MIIDCFIFNDELDMLELRLNTLNHVVDRFVLVEAAQTFQGTPKPRYYEEHRDEPRFAPFRERIVHAVYDSVAEDDPWVRERVQRNGVLYGLSAAHLDYADCVLISDVDELPNPQMIPWAVSILADHPRDSVVFIQRLYAMTLNWRHIRPWYGTRAIRYGALALPQSLRSTLGPRYANEPTILAGGWSFSWMGGVQAIQAKARAFSHTEVNRSDYLDSRHLAACIEAGRSFVPDDGNEYVWQDVDDSYPPYLLEHLGDTFEHWLHDRAIVTGWPV